MSEPFIQPEWIRTGKFSPENLMSGCKYQWSYKTHKGSIEFDEGMFLRMELDKEVNCLWLWFRHENRWEPDKSPYDAPIECSAIVAILELG